ncbi:ABC transporter substrate-binding protein [Rhodococcus sp. HNM0569]|uniref:ABC transporter substrate-binding protein n=1 Tax=Rhodococcus sp. HNM0569 TaxID=2716340 RepID=UPI00146B0807|nr:ABC transporter substrate-binding protein [Rhodococcus sp. HNM0569]NLU84311.1 ABC transporter substrate-binding protein [Rhodococcus sp. HNM0569]
MSRASSSRRTSFVRRGAVAALAASTGVVLTACSGGASSEPSGYDGPIGAVDLSQSCPETIVVQTDWNPEAEHGGMYQMLGPDPQIDAGAKRVSGPLFASGEYTGVDIEIRSGGPAIGFQSVTSQMYQDTDIMLGFVDTDQAIMSAGSNPTTGVYAALEKSPMMIMWDPASHPEARSIADLKGTDAKVLYFEGEPYMDYLTGTGILDPNQVDGSYDGTPANFVAAGGTNGQQGFASSEPYVYENEVEGWKKPVDYQLVHDAGYPTYKSPLAVRSGELDGYASCLEQLVPVMQQAMLDYFADPSTANAVILDAVEQFDTGWVYGQGNADYAIDTMLEQGLVGNGTTPAMGDFDTERVQRLIDITRPVFTKQGKDVPADLTPEQVATNRFVDTSISFPGQ